MSQSPQPGSLGLDELGNATRRSIRNYLLISSILGVIVGAILLFWPDKSLEVGSLILTIMLSIFFLVVGVIRIAVAIGVPGLSGWLRVLYIVVGILLVIFAFFGFANLTIASQAFTVVAIIFLAAAWLVEGITVLAESGRSVARGWSIFYGIVSILAALALLVAPLAGAATLVWVSGIFLVAGGVVGILRAVQLGR